MVIVTHMKAKETLAVWRLNGYKELVCPRRKVSIWQNTGLDCALDQTTGSGQFESNYQKWITWSGNHYCHCMGKNKSRSSRDTHRYLKCIDS